MSYWMDNGRLGVGIEDYKTEDARDFIEDCEMAGLHPFHYEGRNFWNGPAVTVCNMGQLQTSVNLQQDNMGLDYVIYPHSRASLITEVPMGDDYEEDEE